MSALAKFAQSATTAKTTLFSTEARDALKFFARWDRDSWIAAITIVCIVAHLFLRFVLSAHRAASVLPLWVALLVGGVPLLFALAKRLLKGEFGSDLLAGISIVTAVLLGEYLVGAIVVLMLSGGTALETLATRRASSVLDALARRMPQTAHRKSGDAIKDVSLGKIAVGDVLVVFPHEICPVDGSVIDGHGKMDEAYLTGEPFEIAKTPGSAVLSGAINGETALTIRAEKGAVDSRYARIMQVMRDSEQRRPRLRRLGDRLGAWYTPVATAIAVGAWFWSGIPSRFLSVLVIATPCPLLIAIPVAIIGAISVSARRGIVVKNPAVLEQIDECRVMIFDKTGTLTYGKPSLAQIVSVGSVHQDEVLRLAASVEIYSRHPLAKAIIDAARNAQLLLHPASEISERPGEGLRGVVNGHQILLTGRKKAASESWDLPTFGGGLECVVFVDRTPVAVFRFHDKPRTDSQLFVKHLRPQHKVRKVMLVSGDQESEVQYLAKEVGIEDVYSSRSPEEKLELVRSETASAKTLFVGDGINDAPAMQAATVGVAFGQSSDITVEAADAVVLESLVAKVDELIHIGRRMRRIALQSAVGGMALSMLGMAAAALGFLPPVEGAIAQEIIDLAAVLNAIRVAVPVGPFTDF